VSFFTGCLLDISLHISHFYPRFMSLDKEDERTDLSLFPPKHVYGGYSTVIEVSKSVGYSYFQFLTVYLC
jgi:hypothetical protein